MNDSTYQIKKLDCLKDYYKKLDSALDEEIGYISIDSDYIILRENLSIEHDMYEFEIYFYPVDDNSYEVMVGVYQYDNESMYHKKEELGILDSNDSLTVITDTIRTGDLDEQFLQRG